MKRIIYALPLLALLFIISMLTLKIYNTGKLELIRKPVPEFSVPVFADETQTLTQDDLKGEVKMLTFSATWCPTCIMEHRQLKNLTEKHGIKLYGVAYRDDPKDLANLLNNHGNPYQKIGFDPTGTAYVTWGVTGMPESYIIDQNGFIRYKHAGAIDANILRDIILPVIELVRKEKEK